GLQDLAGNDQRLDGGWSGCGLAHHPLSWRKTAWPIFPNSPTNLGTNTHSRVNIETPQYRATMNCRKAFFSK
ncbi:MAG TPA: hypothetical protein VMT46_14065, partial [Anaerolineaceae bacterium]|nr:hypothetical protein [Anaerolineaceae bacterium]